MMRVPECHRVEEDTFSLVRVHLGPVSATVLGEKDLPGATGADHSGVVGAPTVDITKVEALPTQNGAGAPGQPAVGCSDEGPTRTARPDDVIVDDRETAQARVGFARDCVPCPRVCGFRRGIRSTTEAGQNDDDG